MRQTATTIKRRPPGLALSLIVLPQLRVIEDGKNANRLSTYRDQALWWPPPYLFFGLFVKVFLLSFRLQPRLLRLHLRQIRHADFQVDASNRRKKKVDRSATSCKLIYGESSTDLYGFSAESYRDIFSHLAVDQATRAWSNHEKFMREPRVKA